MSELKVNKISPRSGTTITLGDSGDAVALGSGASVSGLTLSDNILFNAASKGIYLGVTSATASNLLDDYEEGTWTPTAGAYGGTITFSEAYYTKIGRFVFCTYRAEFDTANDGSIYSVTLPFTPKLITTGVFGGHINRITNTPQTNLNVLIDNNSAAHFLGDYNGANKDFDQVKDTSSTMEIRISCYFMT